MHLSAELTCPLLSAQSYLRHSAKTWIVPFKLARPGMRKAEQPPSPLENTGVYVTLPGCGPKLGPVQHSSSSHVMSLKL